MQVFDAFLKPTLSIDASATEAEHAAAIESVEPIVVKKGQVVVEKGSIVSESQFALLESMDLVKGEDSNTNLTFGVLLITLLLFALFAVYMRFMEKKRFQV